MSLRRWRPLKIGLFDEPNELGAQADWAPFRRTGALGSLDSIASRTGYAGVYGHVLRRSRARLIHAHFGPDALTVLPIARRHRLPLVVTFHGYDVTTRVYSDHTGEYRRQLASLFAYAELLLPVSEFLAEQLMELGAPEGKIRVHYLGIPVKADCRPSGGPRSGVLFVGRLVEKKGVADLITAYGALPAAIRKTHPLRIVGEGPLAESLHALAGPISDEVDFCGWRDPDSVSAAMGAARVFCGPSKIAKNGDAEGFGLVFLEAARAGLPVVAYRSAGVPEAVRDGVTGLLVPEGDVRGLTGCLLELLTDTPRAQALGAAGQRRVLGEFDIRRQTELLEEIYDEVAYSGRVWRGGGRG